jgi:hypothetical protein
VLSCVGRGCCNGLMIRPEEFGGKVFWWVDKRAAIGGKQYVTPGSYTITYGLKTSSSWEQHVVSAPVLCTVGVVIMFRIELHWIHQNTWRPVVYCLFSGCGISVFRMASSNSSLTAKSCACTYIAFLAGILSWYADSSMHMSSVKCIQSYGCKIWIEETDWRPRHRWEDNIEIDLKEIGMDGVYGINLAWTLLFHKRQGISWLTEGSVSFSRMTLFCGVSLIGYLNLKSRILEMIKCSV